MKIKCNKCGYAWFARVQGLPTKCPRCFARLGKENAEAQPDGEALKMLKKLGVRIL